MSRNLALGDGAQGGFHLVQRLRGVHVAGNHQDGVVGGVPAVVEGAQKLGVGLVEAGAGAQRIVLIGRAGEHDRLQLGQISVDRAGEIAAHLLLDGAPLLLPIGLVQRQAAHAQGFHAQRHGQVGGRHGVEILRHGFGGVGIIVAAQHGAELGELIAVQTRGAAEHHVFQRMRGSGESGRGIV